jgi:GT2 family glycosyltransferase
LNNSHNIHDLSRDSRYRNRMNVANVVVFIIDLNHSIETEQSIRAVLKSSSVNVITMVHINGSSQEHAQRLLKTFHEESRVVISRTEKNLGFSGANNFLMKKLIEEKFDAEYILILNNDAYVEPDTIAKLISVLGSHADIGVVGPRILQHGGEGIIASDGAHTWPWLMQQSFRNSGKRIQDCPVVAPFEVPFVPGTCMLMRADLFIKLGGFDEIYFAYFEDWDLCLNIRRHAYRCLHVADASVWHVGSLTAGMDSLIYHFMMTRNRYLMASKYMPFPVFVFLFMPYFIIFRIVYKVIILLVRKRIQGIKGIILALAWIIAPSDRKSEFWPIGNT